jgi:hypothetical protein
MVRPDLEFTGLRLYGIFKVFSIFLVIYTPYKVILFNPCALRWTLYSAHALRGTLYSAHALRGTELSYRFSALKDQPKKEWTIDESRFTT